jgi:tetratricopeptide (TPR) repeat protein
VGSAVAALVLAVVVLALSTAWVWRENQAKKDALTKAQANFGKAMEAVQRMLTRVADERVAAIPQMKEVRQRLLEDAAAFYTDLIALSPDDARAYHERGWVYFVLGSFGQARADFERAAAMEPDNAEYHGTLGTFFVDCPDATFRDPSRGVHHARRMVELRPDDAEARGILATTYLRSRQRNEGVAELRKGAELARGTALEHKLLAVAEQAGGDGRKVVAHLQQARQLSPFDLWVYHELAGAHLRLGADDQALVAAERGLQLALQPSDELAAPSQFRGRWRGIIAYEPTSNALSDLYARRAEIYLRQKNYAAAVADLTKSFDVFAGSARVWYWYNWRALAHFRLGNYEQALADVAHAVEIKPEEFYYLAPISPEMVASCPDEKFRTGMLALAGRAIERTDHNANGYAARGILHGALKHHDEARADFEKAVELGARNPGALNSVAWYLATSSAAEFRDPKRAVALATKALELAPKARNILNTLGAAHYRAGDWKAAITALEKSMELAKGGNSCDWFFLAMAHWRLGDREKARDWYDKAVAWMDKLKPDNLELARFRAEYDDLKCFRAEAAELLGVKDLPPRKGVAPSTP